MRRLTLLLITALALAAACGGDDDNDGDSDSGDASPTAAATSSPAPSPAATTGSGTGTAGTLTAEGFSPTVSFDVPDGWTLVEDTAGAFLIEHVEGFPPEQQAYIVVHKVTDVRNPKNFSEAQPLPEDITGWLAANRHLIVDRAATPVTLDGIAGSQIDLRTNLNFEPTLFGLAGRPVDDGLYINFLDHVRVIELQDVEGGAILIWAGADEQAYFDQVLPLIEPVIASIDFE